MPGELSYIDGAIQLAIDLRVYRLSAIKKAAYRVADRCTAVITDPTEHAVNVSLRFRPNTAEAAALEVARQYFEELLDQELREQVAEETDALRSLILAQAFSKTDLIRRQS